METWRRGSAVYLLALVGSILAPPAAMAVVVCPQTARAYEFVVDPGVSWTEARDAAAARIRGGVAGHLATLTSVGEAECLKDLILPPPDPGGVRGAWVGGVQDPGAAEPDGGWGWITGEPLVYTDWCPGEPNDGGADYMEVWVDESRVPAAGCWNDAQESTPDILGYVVEWPRRGRMSGLGVGVAYEVAGGVHSTRGLLSLALEDIPVMADGSAAAFDACLDYVAEGAAVIDRGRVKMRIERTDGNGRTKRLKRISRPIRDSRAYRCKTIARRLEVGDLLTFDFAFIKVSGVDSYSITAMLYPAGEAPAAPE